MAENNSGPISIPLGQTGMLNFLSWFHLFNSIYRSGRVYRIRNYLTMPI